MNVLVLIMRCKVLVLVTGKILSFGLDLFLGTEVLKTVLCIITLEKNAANCLESEVGKTSYDIVAEKLTQNGNGKLVTAI